MRTPPPLGLSRSAEPSSRAFVPSSGRGAQAEGRSRRSLGTKPRGAASLLRCVAFLTLLLALSACSRPTPAPTPTPRAEPLGLSLGTKPRDEAPSADSTPTLIPTPTPAENPTTTVAPPPVTATATPLPTATATILPTATPTFLPPTSSPVAELLAQADRLLHNGDYAAAASAYQSLLAAHPSDPLSAAIAFALGRSYWLAGDTEAAAVIFADLSQDATFSAEHPETLYWLGRARAAQGRADEAAAAFRTYADRRPLLAAHAHEAIANAYTSALDPANAIANFQQALALAPDQITRLRAHEGIAAASIQAGDPATAISNYQTILAEARNPTYRAETLYLLGQAQLAAGQSDAAWESFRLAMLAQPENNHAYLAAIALADAGQPIDDLLRARVDLAARAYEPGFAALARYRATHPDHDGESYALAAQAYESQGDYASAASEWGKLLDALPNDRRAPEAWLGKARSLWRQGDTAGAGITYLQAADRSNDRETTATALWWAGLLAERDPATLLDAATLYQRLARDYPENKNAAQAEFRAGLAYHRVGDDAQAGAIWTALTTANKSLWSAAADFWLGKLLLLTGDDAGAAAHWQAAAQRWGQDNYYGLRAAQQAALRATPPPPDPPSDSEQNLADWLATWTNNTGPIDPSLDSSQTPAILPPELERIAELHRIGDYTSAHAAFESLRQRWSEDPVALLRLALLTRDLGYYAASIRAAARVVTLSGQPLAQTPLPLQKLIYPLYYADLILPAAAQNDLDPYTFLALIRQESLFGSVATSGAAARGLAQIIPSTGRSIAERLNWPNYSDELLYRPYVNVTFGAFYLSQSRDAAGGNMPQALAGYNGGPGNAGFWRKLAGPDDDLFLELITFTETQTYLRQIAVQANHFRRLYPDLHAE